MTRHCGPRRDSSAFIALERLDALGGSASVDQLISSIRASFRSNARFTCLVGRPLLMYKFILVIGDKATITPLGAAFVRSSKGLPPLKEKREVVVTAPVVLPVRPLDVTKYFSGGPQRPGSADFRDIPSLMGNERLAYRRKSA